MLRFTRTLVMGVGRHPSRDNSGWLHLFISAPSLAMNPRDSLNDRCNQKSI